MPIPRLRTQYQVPDIQSRDRYEFITGSTPGSNDRNLHLKCSSISAPGKMVDPIVVNLFGHQIKHRGKENVSQELQVTYFEDENFATSRALRSWFYNVVNDETGNSSGSKTSYAIDGIIKTFTSTGRENFVMVIGNMWPQDIQAFELGSDGSSPVLISITFAYDYTRVRNIGARRSNNGSFLNNGLGSLSIGDGFFTDTFNSVLNAVPDFIDLSFAEDAINFVSTAAQTADQIINTGSEIYNSGVNIYNDVSNIISNPPTSFSGAIEAVDSVGNSISGLLSSLGFKF